MSNSKKQNTLEHIVVVYGGDNSEREVSLASGKEVGKALLQLGYRVSYLDPKNSDFVPLIQALKPDVVFNALHGSFGEDGVLPAILDELNIAYTHSGMKASVLAWDKSVTKIMADSLGIVIPKSELYKVGEAVSNAARKIMQKPFVIKAVAEGSSNNMKVILQPNEFQDAEFDDLIAGEYLIEEYIAGREISIAVFQDKVIGSIEIVTKSEYYDYQAKYEASDNQYIVPADISQDLLSDIEAKTQKLHEILGCKNISRSDFIFADGKFYFLELNTHPGLTSASLVPKIAAFKNISMSDIVGALVTN